MTSFYRVSKCFFLDHAQEQERFPPNFNQLMVKVILNRLGLADASNGQELAKLWQISGGERSQLTTINN